MKLSLKTLVAAISLPVLMTACASNGDNVKEITAQDLQHHNWEEHCSPKHQSYRWFCQTQF